MELWPCHRVLVSQCVDQVFLGQVLIPVQSPQASEEVASPCLPVPAVLRGTVGRAMPLRRSCGWRTDKFIRERKVSLNTWAAPLLGRPSCSWTAQHLSFSSPFDVCVSVASGTCAQGMEKTVHVQHSWERQQNQSPLQRLWHLWELLPTAPGKDVGALS